MIFKCINIIFQNGCSSARVSGVYTDAYEAQGIR